MHVTAKLHRPMLKPTVRVIAESLPKLASAASYSKEGAPDYSIKHCGLNAEKYTTDGCEPVGWGCLTGV